MVRLELNKEDKMKIGRYIICLMVIALLMAPLCFAATPRNPTSSEAKTVFTNIAVKGLNVDGVFGGADIRTVGTPGYIEMTSTANKVYYLFIDSKGDLRIASEVTVGFQASPAIVGWQDASGTVVGTQTGIGF